MNEELDVEAFAPWLVVVITLVGGFLRAFLLDAKGIWLDEAFSVWMANHTLPDMLQWIVKIDQHPPLYYLLLHYWIAYFGDTPYYVRLLSVLFSAGTIPIIYLIGKRLSGAAMGLAAAVILAFSLFHIYFAQETRMYTLLTFNAAAAIYALVRLLTDARSARPIGSQLRNYLHGWRSSEPLEPDNQREFRYQGKIQDQSGWRAWVSLHRWPPIQTIETDLAWVAFIVFSTATLFTHNTSVLFPVATNIFVLGLMLFRRMTHSGDAYAFQAPSFGNWVKAQIAILLLWSPWMFFFIAQASAVNRRFWIPEPTWETVIQVIRSFLNASAPLPAGQATAIWSLYGLVLCLGLMHYRRRIPQFLLLMTLFAVPFLGELIVSIWRPIFLGRTLIWTTIPLFLVLAAGVAQFRWRFLVIVMLGILSTINLFSAADYYRFYQKEDWNTAAGYVALFAEKDDLVLFNSNFVAIPFDYYFKTYERLYSIHVEKQGVPLDLFDSGISEPLMTTDDIPKLLSLLRGHDRVWLVYSHDSYTDPEGIVAQTLASQRKLMQTREFYGGQVQLYGTP
ncbi:MAG: glycosyltransferase family 39 protein [Caldilineaceae bacterium]|nr:glycosyltransferase family 39 protein [Caldilineaceae bacterium]